MHNTYLMETPKRPLKHAADGRRYSQWTTPTKFKHCDMTILFPTGYRWHSDEQYKWICPIRNCQNIFEFKHDLSDHTKAFHQNEELNDNLDGTASVVGSCLSDYPQIVSRGRPARSAPSAAEPGLPSVSPAALRASLEEPLTTDLPPSPTISKVALAEGRTEQNDTSSSPITTRLNAAKRYHKKQSVPANVLKSAAISPPGYEYEDDAVMIDDEVCVLTLDGPRQERSSTFRAGPKTPPPLEDKTPKTPTTSTGLFMTPNRSSERLLLRRLSASSPGFRAEPESPSARRSARIHDKKKEKAILPSPGTIKQADMTTKLNRKVAKDLRPINTKRPVKETGLRDAFFSTPNSAKRACQRGRTNSIMSTSSKSSTGTRQLQTRTRINTVEAEIDACMGRSVSELIDSLKHTPKRTQALLIRRDIHLSPNGAEGSTLSGETSGAADLDANNDNTEIYITPPSSQEHFKTGRALPSPQTVSQKNFWPSPEILMEKWEVSPGTISLSDGQLGFIAYSGAYLNQPHAVPISPGIGTRVLRIESGCHERLDSLGLEQKKDMLGTVTCGKAAVRITTPHTSDTGEFSVGLNGVFKVAYGHSCLVVNKWYEPLSLQIMEFTL